MKQTQIKKLLSFILCMVLIAAMALCFTGCKNDTNKDDDKSSDKPSTTQTSEKEADEGKTTFDFIVVDADGKETAFEIKTDKTTVGDALLEQGLIDGEEGQYGLYVKTVNGITVDYDKDGKYWAFYVNGEYAMTGVDATEIVEGDTYSFKVE